MIVAPLIVIGAFVFMQPDGESARRPALDFPGALLIAAGSFSLIFGLSEGATYGWWNPLKDLTIGGAHGLAGDAADLDHPGRVRARDRDPHRVRRARTG